jgi:hypothetical protein
MAVPAVRLRKVISSLPVSIAEHNGGASDNTSMARGALHRRHGGSGHYLSDVGMGVNAEPLNRSPSAATLRRGCDGNGGVDNMRRSVDKYT